VLLSNSVELIEEYIPSVLDSSVMKACEKRANLIKNDHDQKRQQAYGISWSTLLEPFCNANKKE
jgi:hypothetical protein